MPASYSWTEHGISESAAQGVDGAWVTRTGFILFGLAVLWLARLRNGAWKLAGTALHGAFAMSMFAVAAFSAKAWEPNTVYVESEDVLHSVFAGIIGFGFIVGVVAVMAAWYSREALSARASSTASAHANSHWDRFVSGEWNWTIWTASVRALRGLAAQLQLGAT